ALLLACFQPITNNKAVQSEHKANTYQSADGVRFQVETVVSGLEVPWSLAFQGEDLYFTERRGKLWVLKKGNTTPSLTAEINDVAASGEGGLMGLTFHPHFKENGYLYLSFSY